MHKGLPGDLVPSFKVESSDTFEPLDLTDVRCDCDGSDSQSVILLVCSLSPVGYSGLIAP